MTASVIALQAVPSQFFDVTLGGQQCAISVYQRRGRVYLDLTSNGVRVITGAWAHDRSWLVRAAYTGFIGELYFADTQGTDDPSYEGLGARWILVYEDAPS